MKNRLEARLKELREEYQAGSAVMAELQQKQDELRSTLLRISGAMQVLEEVLASAAPDEAADPRLVAD